MGQMTIRDDAIWARHIESDPELRRRIGALPQDAAIELVIDGRSAVFEKMKDGRDGRPVAGLRPSPADRAFWRSMQARRGEVVEVRLPDRPPAADPYLAFISGLLPEWDSPEDAAAYDEL